MTNKKNQRQKISADNKEKDRGFPVKKTSRKIAKTKMKKIKPKAYPDNKKAIIYKPIQPSPENEIFPVQAKPAEQMPRLMHSYNKFIADLETNHPDCIVPTIEQFKEMFISRIDADAYHASLVKDALAIANTNKTIGILSIYSNYVDSLHSTFPSLTPIKFEAFIDCLKDFTKSAELSNNINHPACYGGDTTYEVIKVLSAWELLKDFSLGNAVKLIARAGKVDDNILADLEKAKWYLEYRINELKNHGEANS